MQPISEIILKDYQVRKTKKQKDAFIALMQEHYPELQVEQGGMAKSRNLVIGDVDTAKVVYTAHYDTCAVLPVPNFIMPKNILLTLLYGILICIPFFVLLALVEGLLLYLTDSFLLSYWVSLGVMIAALLWVFMLGKPNQHTANDNTSGTILLCELMAALSEEEKKNAAFVFFDNEENGLLGSGQFRKKHGKAMKGKLLVNFDCVSDGDHMLFVVNKKARKQYGAQLEQAFPGNSEKSVHFEKSSTTMYPSDQMGFPVSVGVAAMNRKPLLGYYMNRIHTKRDVIFQEENIRLLRDGGKRLVELLMH